MLGIGFDFLTRDREADQNFPVHGSLAATLAPDSQTDTAADLLSQLSSHAQGAQLLYASVLELPAPVSKSSLYQRGKALKTTLPALPKKVPAKHHAFVTALGQMLGKLSMSEPPAQ